MLKLYKNTTPNLQNGLHYYFTDFEKYLEEIGEPYLNIEKNSYQINNDVVLVNTNNQNVDVDAITYIIDYDTTYYRCYHVTSADLQSGYILFNVNVDYWGSFIAKCAIENILVSRCNRNIGNGIFKDIQLTTTTPIIDDYSKIFNKNELCIIYVVLLQNSQSSLFQNNSSTSLHIYGEELRTYENMSINEIIDIISGIYSAEATIGTLPASVLKAYILPSIWFYARTDPTLPNLIYKSTNSSGARHPEWELAPTHINTVAFGQSLIEINPNYKYYVGTNQNLMELPRTTQQIRINIKTIVSQDDVQILLYCGDNYIDISQSFSVTLTTNDGNLTTQQQISKTLQTMTSFIGGYAQMMTGGVGLFSGATSIVSAFQPSVTRMGHVKGGNGIDTFTDHNNEMVAPIKLLKYQSINNEIDITKLYGANFNVKIDNLNEIFESDFIIENTTNTFIELNCNVNNVCVNAVNEIKNKLSGGIYVKQLQ